MKRPLDKSNWKFVKENHKPVGVFKSRASVGLVKAVGDTKTETKPSVEDATTSFAIAREITELEATLRQSSSPEPIQSGPVALLASQLEAEPFALPEAAYGAANGPVAVAVAVGPAELSGGSPRESASRRARSPTAASIVNKGTEAAKTCIPRFIGVEHEGEEGGLPADTTSREAIERSMKVLWLVTPGSGAAFDLSPADRPEWAKQVLVRESEKQAQEQLLLKNNQQGGPAAAGILSAAAAMQGLSASQRNLEKQPPPDGRRASVSSAGSEESITEEQLRLALEERDDPSIRHLLGMRSRPTQSVDQMFQNSKRLQRVPGGTVAGDNKLPPMRYSNARLGEDAAPHSSPLGRSGARPGAKMNPQYGRWYVPPEQWTMDPESRAAAAAAAGLAPIATASGAHSVRSMGGGA